MGRYGNYYGGWPSYIPVAERRREAARMVASLQKKGHKVNPVVIEGRVIAKTFWGKAWCKNLESYSDYDNRLPRGRTYVRNGSVINLEISSGQINALVSGSSIYEVTINISPVMAHQWKSIVDECSGKIDSLIELLQGKFSKGVMEIMTHSDKGLFPQLKEITLNCNCFDYVEMCKHVAAVLYSVGARLDEEPETLFLLRNADHMDLLSRATTATLSKEKQDQGDIANLTGDLSSLFGIDIEENAPSVMVESEARVSAQVQHISSRKKSMIKARSNRRKMSRGIPSKRKVKKSAMKSKRSAT